MGKLRYTLLQFGLIASLLSQYAIADDATLTVDEQSAAVVAQVYRGFANGDMAGILALMSEDVDWIHPGHGDIPFAGIYKGKQGVQDFFENAFKHLDVVDQQVFDFLVKGDRVAALGSEKMRVKMTGREYESNWIHLYTIRDAKVVRFEEFIDTAAVAAGFAP